MTTYHEHRVHAPHFYAVNGQESAGRKIDDGVDGPVETAGAIPDSPRLPTGRPRVLGLGSSALVTVGAVMIVLCAYDLFACLDIWMSTSEGDSLLGYAVAAGLFGLLFGLLGMCAVTMGWRRATRLGSAERQSGWSLSGRSRVLVLLGTGALLAVGAVMVLRGIHGLSEFLYEVADGYAYSRHSASGLFPHLYVLLGVCAVIVGVSLPHVWEVLRGKLASRTAHTTQAAVAMPNQFCSSCGSENPQGAVFCVSCGAGLLVRRSRTQSQYRQVEQPPRSRLGIASFVSSLVPPTLVLIFFVTVLVLVAVAGEGQVEPGDFMGPFLLFAGAATAVVAVVALVLGIIGLVQKQRSRPFAILGTVFSGGWIVLAVTIFFVIVGKLAD